MNDNQPIYQQVVERIESDIITGVYQTDDLIISTTQIAKLYSINPTTAVRAIGKLFDAGILYKRRGIGMCVAEGAREKITARRKQAFLNQTIDSLLLESKTLGITTEQLIEVISNKSGESNND
ncbi:MAG: GntR family transcriptional regulator [Oscillospiraceae bacterium]|nr:GntR family transcriptional regulator [Oscillospiraceae bacterium]